MTLVIKNIGGTDSTYRNKEINSSEIRTWSLVDLFTNTDLTSRENPSLAPELYKLWISGNDSHPLLYNAYFNYAISLANSGDRAGAINALRECIRLNPDFQPPYINLGRLLEDDHEISGAISIWNDLVDRLKTVNAESIKHKLIVLKQIGRVLEMQEQDTLAEDVLKQSLEIDIAQPDVMQHWISLRQRKCKWPVLAGWDSGQAEALVAGIAPLSLANLIDDPLFQLARAYKHNKESVGRQRPQRDAGRFLPLGREANCE